MIIVVAVVPKVYPGNDKFTAIRAQLRLIGIPVCIIPDEYHHLLQLMERAMNKGSYIRAVMHNSECFVHHSEDNKSYLIKQWRQTND
jgi:hypothetical protein